MNRKYRNILIVLLITMYFIIAMPSKSNAGLQSNKGGKSLTNVSANGFFVSIRRMESQNGTLGKNATFDQTSYVDSSGNGIDSHMALNTEFGTAGILAYSEYGFIPTAPKDTTTGNASGIYQLGYGNYEYVAGISKTYGNDYMNIISKADNRYFNAYATNSSIPGDGVGKLGSAATYPTSTYPIFGRSGAGVLNSSSPYAYRNGSGVSLYSSRAVVVCGEGL
mgnify:FL=1